MKSLWPNIIFLLMVDSAIAQVLPGLRFSHLTEKEGLSNDEVHSIAQDKDGIIWIGTENGLSRFDGYGFKCFYANPDDPQSIPNNRIQFLVPDTLNNLWGSTADGIFCFNEKTQHASVFKSDPKDPATFGSPYHPPFIYLDSTQLPWVSADEGLYHFYDSLHYKKVWPAMNGMAPPVRRNSIAFGALIKDNTGSLWSCWGNTIFSIDAGTKKVVRAYKCPVDIVIRQFVFDRNNRCWVSTWGSGLYIFDPRRNDWQPFCPSNQRPVVYGGAEWQIEGRPFMVFACSTPALLLVDEQGLKPYTYPFDSSEVTFAGPPFVDRQNILWVPSRNGIYYSTSSNNLFNVITLPVLISEVGKPRYSFAYNMKEDSSGYWLSKRYYGGLFWYDKHWRLNRSWQGVPVPFAGRFAAPGARSGEAFDFQRRGDEMFITTESGISILDLRTLKWTILSPPDDDTLAPPRLRTIIVADDQTWWIRSFDRGVFVFNPVTRKFIRHYRNDNHCKHCLPLAMHFMLKDPKQGIFASTTEGLYKYDPATDGFDKVGIKGSAAQSRALFGLACDSSGLIWIGSESGLFAYNPVTNAIEKTFKEDNKIGIAYRICIDDHQNVWFCSNTGYWCWLRKTDKVVHFEFNLGLPKIDGGYFYKTSDGSVYCGGKDAVVRFYPERLMNYQVTARTRIIDAIVNDTVAGFRTNADGHRQLILSQDRNSFSVDFDVINYDLVGTNQYFYRLSPGASGWKQSETGHLLFYNLQPGSYALEVKGASKLTGNFTNTDRLDIVVNPFWYQTAWFKVGSILFLCLLATLLVRYRIEVVRKQGAFKQQMTEMEMTALRAQMNPHFIFNSLNSIENFMMKDQRRLASDYLNKFASLVRLILENSRSSVVPLPQDMEAIQLYVDLEKLRFENKFSYLTDIDDILLKGDYKVAPLLIQPFVENAIVHGLAPSEKPGLYLKISVRLQEAFIHYTIEDNGIGRSESMAYARKYRPGHKSLGLQIIRERMDLINKQYGTAGKLEIIDLYDKDHQPAGTRVTLTTNIS